MLAYKNLTEWAGENPSMPERGVSDDNFFQRLFALVRYSSYKQERTKIAGLLLARQKGNHGAPLHLTKLDRDNTVLSLACKNGLDVIVSLILMVGSQLCCRSTLLTTGTPTPLWQAANSSHAETLAVLIPYVHEADLCEHVAPDGTSPLIMAVMRGNVGVMKQMVKKYNMLDVLDAVAKYGSAKLFEELKLMKSMSKDMLLVAIEAENYVLVKKMVEVANTEKDGDLAVRVREIKAAMLKVEKDVKRPITNVSMRELFALPKWPQGLIQESFLVDKLSSKFPKFNPEIEERTFPLLHQNEVSIQKINKSVLPRFCPLFSEERPNVIREVSQVPLSECFKQCNQ